MQLLNHNVGLIPFINNLLHPVLQRPSPQNAYGFRLTYWIGILLPVVDGSKSVKRRVTIKLFLIF